MTYNQERITNSLPADNQQVTNTKIDPPRAWVYFVDFQPLTA